MLHTKVRPNLSSGSREEDFLWVFTKYWHRGHYGHVTSIMFINFHFHIPESLHTQVGYKWTSGFCEKQVLIFICK